MEQQPCIFCSVVQKKIPAKIVYEDDTSIAFLDIHPRSLGMTIVVPRQHFAEAGDAPDISAKTFESALRISEILKKVISPQTTYFSVIPSREIPHFHVRVYPVTDEVPLIENQPRKLSEEDLENIAKRIREAAASGLQESHQAPQDEEEPEVEDGRSEEEVDWIRRQVERD
jgi:histidine triad (HIT) family protein